MTILSLAPHHGSARAASTALEEMLGFAVVAAESAHPVLLTGETGSGKTHLARMIHEAGPRAGRPFVRVNCAAIPETLFEREMFGHVRGAFTDAREGGSGFLEAADGGTLFLDEVSELSPQIQPKLLAVLEDGVFRRLGSMRETRVDVHVIAACNRSLEEMVRMRQFREDLFFRLSVLRYAVPPLRARAHEIPELVRDLLRRGVRPGHEPPPVTEAAMEALRRHAWPGNIRELDNALRSAAVFARGGPIRPEHLPPEVRSGRPAAHVRAALGLDPSERYAAPPDHASEVRMIRDALEAAGGNKTHAARRLGMSRSTLWAKLHRYDAELRLAALAGGLSGSDPDDGEPGPPRAAARPLRLA